MQVCFLIYRVLIGSSHRIDKVLIGCSHMVLLQVFLLFVLLWLIQRVIIIGIGL